ncbi:hydroxymethylglutaryl-CoA synthase [Basidiobolus meristosporus CBS 931.73]|uniref:Hydroxymethylglutaryl-CoA synthase n=1 Tax=Basidiobolus meristosporus CBS 931.73 TaxID=1314790 RepID=A0A1Y1Y2Z1_9FUNG|nr:hydroxymethylglutaryl-CoA synthase [Basidiobolus meristosporus CBS 931.73]|eukprot:ORX91964.1 hydroxymethylglutaryl-CoA synthase [Basidiobolus meristosporus CBS 931.73]
MNGIQVTPHNVGIKAMEIYFPKKYVEQADMEQFDGVSAGKYTLGLGQNKLGFCDDREDIHSISLTVVQNLVEHYGISYNDIGRLEVGTETILDKAKSCKTVLMQLFADSGNFEVEGIDTTNACYGGTAALSNAVNWVESSSWDGRYALVVAADIAIYAKGPARPTGGTAAVALLVGPDAPIVIEKGLRSTFVEHVYDFYKPDLASEYPIVDGKLSVECYARALDNCYPKYLARLAKKENLQNPGLENFDYLLFHSPYTKLVAKSFARLGFHDFLANHEDPRYAAVQEFKGLLPEETYTNRDLEKAFIGVTKTMFNQKVAPSLTTAKNIGNTYCASLYGCLASLICGTPYETLAGKRVGMFSYGSGSSSTLFSLRVVGSTEEMAKILDLQSRLDSRIAASPEEFDKAMSLREETHQLRDYRPVGDIESIYPGTYYLSYVDEKFRRFYERKN